MVSITIFLLYLSVPVVIQSGGNEWGPKFTNVCIFMFGVLERDRILLKYNPCYNEDLNIK
jgi:hypothetical protein